jgi:hypothetical protein
MRSSCNQDNGVSGRITGNPEVCGTELPKKPGGLNWSVQHHLMNDFLKVVFYDTRKTGQAFHGAAG